MYRKVHHKDLNKEKIILKIKDRKPLEENTKTVLENLKKYNTGMIQIIKCKILMACLYSDILTNHKYYTFLCVIRSIQKLIIKESHHIKKTS